ncbi:MAG: nuclear transport factor 2 family protein, partial [Candidatus Nanohaloarchaea archaeon]|nr:nuclear transport factor 2 family protein [Candidatus Nanohaloarchaea archaeon]
MGGSIDGWLEQFREAWISHDIDAVLDLFTDDVDYYETPFEQLEGKDEIREEWKAVLHQEDIGLSLELYASDDNRHVVQWELEYTCEGG